MAHLKLFLYALLHYLTMKNIEDLNNTFSKFETKWKAYLPEMVSTFCAKS